MILSHNGKSPQVHPSAYIAPTATLCGDISIGAGCRVMHGSSVIAEGGNIKIGEHCIIFENSVLRSNVDHSAAIGNYCLIGPNTHVVGCTVEDEVFIATGAAIFHGAYIGKGSQVRINAIVHIKSYLEPEGVVPIGWIAIGNPARLFPPDKHEEIWKIQKPLNFPLAVYGFDRSEASMRKITMRLSEKLGSHIDDLILREP